MKDRVRAVNHRPFRQPAEYVLYWAQIHRRVEGNFGLAYAIELANDLELPVLFYEHLTCAYPHANDRFWTFVLEGVPDTSRQLRSRGIGYSFYMRAAKADPDDMLLRAASRAAAVVSDEYPESLIAQHNRAIREQLEIPYYAVDSCGVIPLRRFEKREYAAYTIRPKVNRMLPEYFSAFELPKVKHPFRGDPPVPPTVVTKGNIGSLVARAEIDHSVPPSLTYTGGSCAATRRLEYFLENNLRRYERDRNEPSRQATSGMSAYLHFGQIGSLQVATAVRRHADACQLMAGGYLEELIVRRELAFNFTHFSARPASLLNLPEWARNTLREHASDRRDPVYTVQQLEFAETHDALWNAAQKELLLRGTIHGYYRMYWGKKVIEWSPTCQDALERLIYFHDRYALDGRDPNTYANILWLFGLHDRPWGTRPIFGMVRYLSLDGMKRKTDVPAYVAQIAELERTGRDPARVS